MTDEETARFAELLGDKETVKQTVKTLQKTLDALNFAKRLVPDDAPDAEKRREIWTAWYQLWNILAPAGHFFGSVSKVHGVSEEWIREVLEPVLEPEPSGPFIV